MKQYLLFLLIGVFATAAASELVQGSNAFTWDLYHQLSAKGNVVVSPINLSTTLSMAYLGAKEASAKQMAATLHYPKMSIVKLAEAFHDLNAKLKDGGASYQLSLANGIWIDRSVQLVDDYRSLIQKNYSNDLHRADFSRLKQTSREINSWVGQQTKGQVERLLQASDLHASDKLVLVSALYLRAPWMYPFDPRNTETQNFHLNEQKQVPAEMLRRTLTIPYLATESFDMVAIPYAAANEGPQLVMVVLLPKTIEGLSAVEKELDAAKLEALIVAMESKDVGLELPRFSARFRLSAADVLQALGMKVPFTPAANFSGIDGKQDLMLSNVLHEAFIDVNEEGTETGAATAATVGVKSHLPPPAQVLFRVRHPFLFLIYEASLGQFLFIGRITNPTG